MEGLFSQAISQDLNNSGRKGLSWLTIAWTNTNNSRLGNQVKGLTICTWLQPLKRLIYKDESFD